MNKYEGRVPAYTAFDDAAANFERVIWQILANRPNGPRPVGYEENERDVRTPEFKTRYAELEAAYERLALGSVGMRAAAWRLVRAAARVDAELERWRWNVGRDDSAIPRFEWAHKQLHQEIRAELRLND